MSVEPRAHATIGSLLRAMLISLGFSSLTLREIPPRAGRVYSLYILN
jgi:hypothetical protein